MRGAGWRLRRGAAASLPFLRELLGGKRTLGGVRVARIAVLTPPLSSEGLHSTPREPPRLVDANGDLSV